LFQRSTAPYSGIFILNRLGIDNMILNLSDDMEIQILGDYIIYQTSEGKILAKCIKRVVS
jgi:hypothetical protein